MKRRIDELLEAPYWIIDILPAQVPEGSPGQYFAVEKYFLKKTRLAAIKQRHANLILKLNCYRDISLDEDTITNPPPEQTEEAVKKRHVCIMLDGFMIVSEPDDTYLTLYGPDEKLLELVKTIAAGEGLHVWQPASSDQAQSRDL